MTEDFVAYVSPQRMAIAIVASACFVAAGLWMGGLFGPPPSSSRYSPEVTAAMGWICVAFFGYCGVAAAKRISNKTEQLRIGREGVRWARWSDQTIPWSDITDVGTWKYKGQKAIVLRLRDPGQYPGGLSALAGVNRTLSGGDIAISLTGMNRSFADAMAAIERHRGQSR